MLNFSNEFYKSKLIGEALYFKINGSFENIYMLLRNLDNIIKAENPKYIK